MKAPDKSFMFFFSGEKFKEEVKSLQEALTQYCDKEKKPPIYEPTEFFKFCSQHGAANCFNFVLACMTSSRHSEDGISLNRKRSCYFISVMFWFITKMQFFTRRQWFIFTVL